MALKEKWRAEAMTIFAVAFCFFSTTTQASDEKINTRYFNELKAKIGISSAQFVQGRFERHNSIVNLRKAATAGNSNAIFVLARMYYCGDDIDQNMPEAMKLLDQLTTHGSSVAPWLSGLAYLYGDGVTKDRAKGLELIGVAALRGNPYAVSLLIDALSTNRKDLALLLWWLNFGAERGEEIYQRALAKELLLNGSPNEVIAAYYWLLEAAYTSKDPATQQQADEVRGRVDVDTAKVLQEGVQQRGPFRWSDWNTDTLVVGASVLPCARHLMNPDLMPLHILQPRR